VDDYGQRLTQLVASSIDELRKERGLSLEDLAEMCSLHRTSVGLIVRGRRGMTLDTGARLTRALGVSLSEVVASAERRLTSPSNQ
jgi:transcriptional regulator with XRE-family HTH domain